MRTTFEKQKGVDTGMNIRKNGSLMEESASSLLEIENLSIAFKAQKQKVEAVKGISFSIEEGESIAIVGESGSGKSVTALSMTQLLPPPPQCLVNGSIRLKGQELLQLPEREIRKYRGSEIAYIFQEPSSSLNPSFTVGFQIAEAIKQHIPNASDIRSRVTEAFGAVGIQDPSKRFDAYPHELSGGMQQRVMIAMALACEPKILVADEPTTALDVTIQAQIMDLLNDLKAKRNMSIILITHNFAIVPKLADSVLVMFRGKIVESGPVAKVFDKPQHPYTQALLDCIPRLSQNVRRLKTIDHALIEEMQFR